MKKNNNDRGECIPYFYVIRHKRSGMLYMGAKWSSQHGKMTNPATLLQPNGYTTSSDKVNDILDEEGFNSFEVVEIVLESDILAEFQSISKYETYRLRERDPNTIDRYLNYTRTTLNHRSSGQGKQDYRYWSDRENDHLIDWSSSDQSIKWLFQEDNLYLRPPYTQCTLDEQKIVVGEIQKFLKARAYTTMRPEEVGLPPSFKKWRPDVLHQVLHDLVHNLGNILRVQRKRRNV